VEAQPRGQKRRSGRSARKGGAIPHSRRRSRGGGGLRQNDCPRLSLHLSPRFPPSLDSPPLMKAPVASQRPRAVGGRKKVPDTFFHSWMVRMGRMKRFKYSARFGCYLCGPLGDPAHPGYPCPKFLRL